MARLAATVVLLFAIGCSEAHAPFESGAYVQNVTTNSAVVALASHAPEAATVEFGRADRGDRSTVSESSPVTWHRFALEGLEPDTLYRYRVLVAGAAVSSSTFRTAPDRPRPITFAALGDSGQTNLVFPALRPLDEVVEGLTHEKTYRNASVAVYTGQDRLKEALVAERILEDNPSLDLVLHTGDVVYPDGEWGNYEKGFFEPFERLIDHVPLYATVGNHDAVTNGGAPWVAAFVTPANNPEKSPRYYSFDYGPVHFTALDVHSTPFTTGTPQNTWLAGDLAAATRPFKVVFLHAPPFSNGKHGDSAPEISDLVPIFEANHVALVLAGHDHNYQRMKPVNGVTYVITGGGGSSELYEVAPGERLAHFQVIYHYVRVTADASHLALEAVDLFGHVFDSVTIEPP